MAQRVVMYCRSWCPDCSRARVWLHAHRIDFTEIDIEEQPQAAERCRELAGKIVTPTFEIDGVTVVDFDEPRLREMLLS
ncbi:MAG TPA: glutaredoxin family protein [Coriobacteriia bacterium]